MVILIVPVGLDDIFIMMALLNLVIFQLIQQELLLLRVEHLMTLLQIEELLKVLPLMVIAHLKEN